MRPSTSIAALALTLLRASTAMETAFSRKFAHLAEMGLNPDGSPLEPPAPVVAPAIKTSLRAFKSFRIPLADNASTPAPEVITPEYVELPVDNFAKSKNQAFTYQGTFYNRFWVSQRAYKPGGPVFLYDVGEANAETNALFRLQNETSFFRQMVEQYNGIGIV